VVLSMVRSVSFDHVFKVPWEHATTAFWCKYPNRDLEHVKDALVLERYVDDDGILVSWVAGYAMGIVG